MSTRIITFVCGLLVGALLHVTLIEPEQVAPGSSITTSTAASIRCAAHPVKMPCLFDNGGH